MLNIIPLQPLRDAWESTMLRKRLGHDVMTHGILFILFTEVFFAVFTS